MACACLDKREHQGAKTDKKEKPPTSCRGQFIEKTKRKPDLFRGSIEGIKDFVLQAIFHALPSASELPLLCGGNANLFVRKEVDQICENCGRTNKVESILIVRPKKEITKTDTLSGSILVILGGPSRTRFSRELRARSSAALTVHRTVIHYRSPQNLRKRF